MAFFDSPRSRRLKADLEALRMLKENSTILDFQVHGDPAERYLVTFKGKGLLRKTESEPVEVAEVHRVECGPVWASTIRAAGPTCSG